jgi:hypothetical protein
VTGVASATASNDRATPRGGPAPGKDIELRVVEHAIQPLDRKDAPHAAASRGLATYMEAWRARRLRVPIAMRECKATGPSLSIPFTDLRHGLSGQRSSWIRYETVSNEGRR